MVAGFIILRTFGKKSQGTTIEYHELVKCPDCGHEFIQTVSEGCFHFRRSPLSCPECNYPFSIMWKKDKTWNPSKRIK